jgi:hypothetical protein
MIYLFIFKKKISVWKKWVGVRNSQTENFSKNLRIFNYPLLTIMDIDSGCTCATTTICSIHAMDIDSGCTCTFIECVCSNEFPHTLFLKNNSRIPNDVSLLLQKFIESNLAISSKATKFGMNINHVRDYENPITVVVALKKRRL